MERFRWEPFTPGGRKHRSARRPGASSSPEVRSRLERIASTFRPPFRTETSETIRAVRAMQVLDRIGTPEAVALLERISKENLSEYIRSRATIHLDHLASRSAPRE